MKKYLIAVAVTAFAIGGIAKTHAASTSANALQTVIAAISIAKVSDLDFGTAPQGDPAKTVPPGAGEDAENASFTVTGEPNTAYTITLPADGTIKMITGGGGSADKEINVNSFASTPAAGLGAGMLDAGGNQTIFVGATRDALAANQVTGAYTGSFNVTVVY